MGEFAIKTVTGEDLIQYHKLASWSYHTYQKEFGTEEFISRMLEGEERTCQEKSALCGNTTKIEGCFKGDKLVSALRIVAHVAWFDGNRCEMGGIGGVLSDPEERRTGGVKRMMKHALERMHANGQILSHLYPFETSFYRKYGYEHVSYMTQWTIPLESMKKNHFTGILRYDNSERMQKDVKRVYEAFSRQYNLAVEKKASMWKSYFEGKEPCATPFFSFLHYSGDTPDGFFTYKAERSLTEPMTIQVMHLYYANIEALRNILAYLASMGSYAKEATLRLPSDVDISFLLQDPRAAYGRKNVRREILYLGTSRVVDVEKVLRLAKYNGKGSVCIKVSDPLCPWNDKCFRVVFDERCITLEEGGTPDAQMSVNAFSALILGAFSMDDYALLEDVEVFGNEENLKKVFYKKPCWIEDSF